MICSKCGKEEAEWDDLCQMCWEEYCSGEWWRLNDKRDTLIEAQKAALCAETHISCEGHIGLVLNDNVHVLEAVFEVLGKLAYGFYG